ncbi:MAG: ATP-binding protein [Bacteroidales bacterium]|nr:ATP-binding protein [Bacteroidales bacterium]
MEEKIDYIFKMFFRQLSTTPLVFFRYLYTEIDWNDTLIGIKGPKGCGKSTLLLQHIKQTFKGSDLQRVLYMSLDNLWFSSNDVAEIIDYHYTHGGTHVFIDEIHYYNHWQTLLKNLYDNCPGLHIVYTGSSMLQIDRHEGDLSRRQTMYTLHGLSFREFLEYENVMRISAVSLETILTNHIDIATEVCGKIKVLEHFKKYLEFGYYPFYKGVHKGYYQRLQGVVNQIIEVDYPSIDEVTVSTIRKTKKLLMLLAERVPQLPKMNELYRELETDRNQGLKMLNALQRGGLLQLLSNNTKSPDQMSRPEKIYLDNPTLMYALTPQIDTGTLRETFFMNQLSQNHDVRYPSAGDFLVDKKYTFEVGGKSKSFDQIKDVENSYLAVDNIEIGRNNRIPLWMFGMIY